MRSTEHACLFPSLRYYAASILAVACFVSLARADEPQVNIKIKRAGPGNVLPDGKPVSFVADVGCAVAGKGAITGRVVNYWGTEEKSFTVPFEAKRADGIDVPLEVGVLEPGYHEMQVSVTLTEDGGKQHSNQTVATFGTAKLTQRSAREARAAGSRFGIKTWGVDDIWWNRRLKWDLTEIVTATASLGLQWTRHPFDQADQGVTGVISTADLLKLPMNVVLKVEGFPAEIYDAKRYGPMEEWEKKNGKGAWFRKTVPQKEPYQTWLREKLEKLPAEQNVFEIWNEPWGKMTPEEFAEICRMAVPVIKQVRPNAIVGSNTAGGPIAWDLRFIKAGGMDGMNMLTIHPYSFSPPPEQRTRAQIRNYHDFLKQQLGHDLDLYCTEYGWSTAPDAPKAVPERQQAQRTVRQSLMLYAEDIKVLIPHWMGDREQDPKDMDQWFGFWHLRSEPRPVVFAFATCARTIDGSRFIGDLDLGRGVGAMLFERNGTHTLAVWNLEEDPSKARPMDIDVGSGDVTVVDIMGREKAAHPTNGKLKIDVSSDMTYLVGVDAALAAKAIPIERDQDPDLWINRAGEPRSLVRAQHPPKIDGDVSDWPADAWTALGPNDASAPNPKDCHAEVAMSWDAKFIYIAMRVHDNELVARSPDDKKGRSGDRFDVGLGTRPGRQLHLGGWNIFDYTISLAPVGADGAPTLSIANDTWPTSRVFPSDDANVRWICKKQQQDWSAEIAVPLKVLGNITPKPGDKFSWIGTYQDTEDGQTKRVTSTKADASVEWPFLELKD